jgi:hypothetical protein
VHVLVACDEREIFARIPSRSQNLASVEVEIEDFSASFYDAGAVGSMRHDMRRMLRDAHDGALGHAVGAILVIRRMVLLPHRDKAGSCAVQIERHVELLRCDGASHCRSSRSGSSQPLHPRAAQRCDAGNQQANQWHTPCDHSVMGTAARRLEIIIMATTTAFDATQIRPHMPVVCSEGGQFATVDHMDPGNMIKLTKDESGQHHWIPMSWVTRIDKHVHVDRPGKQAMQEWATSNPNA